MAEDARRGTGERNCVCVVNEDNKDLCTIKSSVIKKGETQVFD